MTSQPKKRHIAWLALSFGVLAYLLGIRSLVYFVLFVSNIPLVRSVDSGVIFAWPEALMVNVCLILVFALCHSLMARSSFKKGLSRVLPEAVERSTYVLVSAALLSLLMWQWRPMENEIWKVTWEAGRYLLLGCAAAGWILAALAYYSLNHLELLGLRQTYRFFKGQPQPTPELKTDGIYRLLRDPMYLGFALGLWCTPFMTVGRLLLSAGMTLYVVVGMIYERRDLRARFGHRYLQYLEGEAT